ncbi:carboxypeptidase regulatory-like domain-containing protein [Cesiribacter andamanensis]|uniref:Vi polysaccharide export protein VexE n=1 Tax=Cesiribacter andamanensis AMV16 TaxID=1279009 RepID=M7N3R7_9BACT|nr:carboxypeptidase regulatory-like domain-containing protein [Cesiribacter andamanensis]EMR01937.1 Vi polysaccharide export protein VexE [Cesiribacter andamanensis AMV16]
MAVSLKYPLYAWLIGGMLALLPLGESVAQYDNFFFQLKPAAQKGKMLYGSGAYEKAIPYIQQALRKRGEDQDLKIMLAHAYAVSGQAKEAVAQYRQLASSQQLEPKHQLAYAHSLQLLGRGQESQQVYEQYLSQLQGDPLPSLDPAELHRSAIRYSVHPLSINSRYNEFAPVLTEGGLFFLSDRKKGALVHRDYSGHNTDLDVYHAAARSNTRFVNVHNLGSSINTGLHEGPASQDANGALYFSRSDRSGRITLWKAEPADAPNQWLPAKELSITAEGNLFHPAISADGRLLFYASDMPGGYGSTDIYYSFMQEGGWSAPINAGARINTPGKEAFPSLRENRLYFSSDGKMGLGGLDIHEAYLSGTKVIMVRNVGAPANSVADDFGLVWLADGSGGYFSSNRRGGRGGDDLYRLDYHIITLEGSVRDSTNHKPLAGVTVHLQQPDGGSRQAVTNERGEYSFTLFPGEVYKLSYEAKDYRPRTLSYSTLQGKQYGRRDFTVSLDRKTKIFVLGTARMPDKRRAAHAQILVYDHAGSQPDTLVANERGGYEVELDTESQYTFLVQCNTWGNVADFATSERTEASLSHYLNVELKQQQRYTVKGRVEGADPSQPLLLWLTNSLNGSSTLLWPDGNRFSFQALSLAAYEICVQQGDKRATLYLGTDWQKPERQVVLELK